MSISATDKRVRQLQSALDRLVAASLVVLPHRGRGAGKYEEFQLLDETATRSSPEEPVPYHVPKKTEPTFSVPIDFITQGWVHALEDTEIALLLMVACGRGSTESDHVAIPARDRLSHYAIGRDAFEAHRMLERLGLLEVIEVNRHDDGRAEEYDQRGASLHRLRLLAEGLSQEALSTTRSEIERQLARSSSR